TGTEHLDEVDVGAFGSEMGVTADFRAKLLDHGPVGIGHEKHGMGHAGVERMQDLKAGGERHLLVEPQIFGLGQIDGDAVALKTGFNDAGTGFPGEIASEARALLNEARESASAVSAHFAGSA